MLHLLALLIVLWLSAPMTPGALGQALKGEVSATTENGYARLSFKFEEEIEAQVRIANNIVTINFPRPVDISINRISQDAGGYVSAARRDPDGKGIRIALARKVTMNAMTAGERLFVDFLPDNWSGLAPGLPRDVIDELARRAREGERRARQQRVLAQQQKARVVRVKAITQPTFTRYVFDLPELIAVSADNTREKLTLTFDAMLRFDLADAKATLPPAIESIDSENDHDAVIVRFNFGARVDVRTFREDNSFVVDVETAERKNANQDLDDLASAAAELAERAKANASAPRRAPEAPPAQSAPAEAPQSGPRTDVQSEPPRPPAAQSEPPRPAPQPPRQQAAAPPVPPPSTPASSPPTVEQPKPAPAQPHAAPVPAPENAQPLTASPQAVPVQSAPPQTTPVEESQAGPPPQTAQGAPPPVVAPPAAPATPPRDAASTDSPGAVRAAIKRNGEHLTIAFPFAAPTPAAIFRRADTVWMVFDTDATIGISALNAEQGRAIKSASTKRARDAAVVQVKLERPQLISVAPDGNTWVVTLGNEVVEPTRPLIISRSIASSSRASVTVAIDQARNVHRIEDPEVGDQLYVITAAAPARGFLKTQDFVEFRALASAHGIALQPIADDLTAELVADKVIVSRPGGLSLSSVETKTRTQALYQRNVIDLQTWGFDRQANYIERNGELLLAAADAPEPKRLAARCDLARFYLSRDMFAEAKAVLDVTVHDSPATSDESAHVVLRAIANIMIGRPDAALKDLSNPFVGNQHDAPLWRALANARLGKYAEARDGFRSAEAAMPTLPLEFQRAMLRDMVRAALEVGDVTGAAGHLNEFEMVGVPRELEAVIAVLTGRLAEGLGRPEDALRAYRTAHDSWDRPSAAQARLREIQLQYGRGNQPRGEAIASLETLTTIWRGDQTEIEALQLLGRLYTEEGRYRDAFNVMRTALRAHPNSDMTRRIQEEAMSTFDGLFLAGKGDALPAIDALALFYDFRDLTPIGRRGDEMIRRLADRLVSVDLLYQASEMLQHQIDHRLQGAARAQVASRLAVIYMMDRKPAKALGVLRSTRVADLNNDLRNQRLLLEGRALSDIGRHDVAYEVVANIAGREGARLRSDILWAAKKWARSAEQLEQMLGERWQEFAPLTDTERADVMRAAIGYAMGEDAIGLARFRDRYLSKMGEGPDARAFEVVTAPIGASGTEFAAIVRSIAAIDTLEAFLRDLRARYPETGAMPPRPQAIQPPAAPPAQPATAPGRTAAG